MPNRLRKKKEDKKAIKLAFVFGLFVVFLILSAFFIKAVTIFLNSSYNSEGRFNIALYNDSLRIASFAPEENEISILTVKSQRRLSASDAASMLKIPIDGFIDYNLSSEGSLDEKLWNVLINYNSVKTNLTIIDIARLWLFAKTAPSYLITSQTVSIPKDFSATEELATDKIVNKIFSDSFIENEQLSIQITNSTGVSGLAQRLSRLISNIGGDVVLITTGDKESEVSEILYSQELSYTVYRLSKILGINARKIESVEFSDLIIIIGKDKLSSLEF